MLEKSLFVDSKRGICAAAVALAVLLLVLFRSIATRCWTKGARDVCRVTGSVVSAVDFFALSVILMSRILWITSCFLSFVTFGHSANLSELSVSTNASFR